LQFYLPQKVNTFHQRIPFIALQYTLYHDAINARIAIKGISQHKIPFIAKLPHANRGATDEKRDFRVLFHPLSVTNFSTKNHDNPCLRDFLHHKRERWFVPFIIAHL